MKFFKPLIVSVLTFYSSAAMAEDCEYLENDEIFVQIIDQLNADKAQGLSALRFNVYDYPILLTSENAENCVALYNSTVTFHELESPLEIENGYYSHRDELNPMSEKDEEQLRFMIVDQGVDSFLIYKINENMQDEYSGSENSLRSHYAFLVHEGFHLLAQESYFSWSHYSDGAPYTSWSSESGRGFLREQCYGEFGSPLQERISSEIRKLYSALTHLNEGREAEAMEEVRLFVGMRESRYASLKESLFHPKGWASPENCSKGEAFMENLEGVANYIESKYMLQNKLIVMELLLAGKGDRANRGGSEYYTFGMLQLLILERLDLNFHEIVEAIQTGGEPPETPLFLERLKALAN